MGANLWKLICGATIVAGACAFREQADAIIGIGGLFSSMAIVASEHVGGSFIHEGVSETAKDIWEGVTSRELDIDENHHILLQLRRSHLKALRKLAGDFAQEPLSKDEKNFLEGLESFLDQAGMPDRLLPHDDVTPEEKKVFSILPASLQAGLAARGSSVSAETLKRANRAKAELLQAAFEDMAKEIKLPCPRTFLSLASRDEGGFIDLFVRDAAKAMSENSDFRDIWSAEQLAGIRADVTQLTEITEKGFADLRNQLADIAAKIAHEKGVPLDHLKPILVKLDRTDTPEHDYARVLSEAVDELLARSNEKVIPTNDEPAIDAAISRARQKLKALDTDGALQVLQSARDQQRDVRMEAARGEARLLREQAAIHQSIFDYDHAIAALNEAQELDRDDLPGWRSFGQLYQKLGMISKALETFEQMLAQAEAQDVGEWESVACDHVGDILLQQGDLKGALARYERGLGISELLAAQDVKDAQAQRDVSVSYYKIGDVLLQQGDLKGALARYERGLGISELLAAQDVKDAQTQRDVSVSYYKIGDVLLQQGDLKGALARYERGLGIRELLAAQDVKDAQAQRDVSVSYNKIGDVLLQQGDLKGALARYERGLGIRELLAAQDVKDAQAQRDVSVSYNKIGDVLLQQGDLKGASARYKRGLGISELLAAQEVKDAQAQRDVWVSLWKLAMIHKTAAAWQLVVARLLAMQANGTLTPVDEQFVESARANLDEAAE